MKKNVGLSGKNLQEFALFPITDLFIYFSEP